MVLDAKSRADTDGNLDDTYYYLTDANMNVTCLVDTSGDAQERYSYDPYGEATIYDGSWSGVTWATSKQNHVQYAGYYFDDESGFNHVRNRPYHPTLAVWISRDPSGYADGMNLYEYVRGNPIRLRDSHGLAAVTNTCYCGPDVTDWLVQELIIWSNWIDRLLPIIHKWVDADTAWYGSANQVRDIYRHAFMLAIGPKLTYFPTTTFSSKSCPTPPNCKNTVALAGTCIHTSEVGNFVYGFVAEHFLIDWPVTWYGSVKGNRGKRTDADAAAVGLGWDYGKAGGFLRKFLKKHRKRFGTMGSDTSAECKPCPESLYFTMSNHVKLPTYFPPPSKVGPLKMTLPSTVD